MKLTTTHKVSITVAIIGALALIAAAVISLGGAWQPTLQANVNGNGNVTAVGENAQATVNNEFPKPTIEYSTSSPPTFESDGYIHQTYKLRFYYVLGTAPQRTFKISNSFVNCSEPKGDPAPSFANGRYYESSTIECWMKKVPPREEVLFWYSG